MNFWSYSTLILLSFQLRSTSDPTPTFRKSQDTQLDRRGHNTYVEAKSWTLQLCTISVVLKSQLRYYSVQRNLTIQASVFSALHIFTQIRIWADKLTSDMDSVFCYKSDIPSIPHAHAASSKTFPAKNLSSNSFSWVKTATSASFDMSRYSK